MLLCFAHWSIYSFPLSCFVSSGVQRGAVLSGIPVCTPRCLKKRSCGAFTAKKTGKHCSVCSKNINFAPDF